MVRSSSTRQIVLLAGIVLLAVGIPLTTINQPFIDRWSWRQSDVAAISRNYTLPEARFAYPQIDWAGNAPGYVGTEFPILPFVAAAVYRVAGIHEWIGRVQSLVFFAISIPFFILLVRETLGESAATWSTVFYSFAPVVLMSSRCFMPDMPSLSLSLGGLYFFSRWLRQLHWPWLLASGVALALAILVKLPTAIIGAPLACLVLQRFGWSALRRPALWLFAILVLAPPAIWYWHAAQVAREFYPHHFFGAGGVELMPIGWYIGIARRIAWSSITIVPLVLACFGLWLARNKSAAWLFYSWLAAIALFVVIVGYGNRHPWYQLPLVPVVAAFAGYGTNWIQNRLGTHRGLGIVAMTVIAGVFAAQSFLAVSRLYRPAAADLRLLGLALRGQTTPGSLIIVADYGDPTALYYGERKGWHFTEEESIYNGHPHTSEEAIADLEHLREQGATHIAFYSGSMWWPGYYGEFGQHLTQTSELVGSSPAYRIYKLHALEKR